MAPIHHPWVFTFGLLGNIISFIVYLAPVPTFVRIYKKKSTEGFQSIPYICAIFSSMLWLYYAMVKTNTMLLITINSFGCVIETIYIAIYLTYADKQAKVSTIKLLVLLNFVGFSIVLLVCHYLPTQTLRVQVLGWICVGFAVVVFAAPLSIIRLVIRTKSVEFMPFSLSFTLTISAVMWFMYGLLLRDMYIILPNILGFTFGVAQMILYGIYKNNKKPMVVDEEKVEPTEMKLTSRTTTTCNNPTITTPPAAAFNHAEIHHSSAVGSPESKLEDNDHKADYQKPDVQLPRNDDLINGCHIDEIKIAQIEGAPAAAKMVVECAV